MGAGAEAAENLDLFFLSVDQKPVWFNMEFSHIFELFVVYECVIPVFCWNWFFVRKNIQDFFHFLRFTTTL